VLLSLKTLLTSCGVDPTKRCLKARCLSAHYLVIYTPPLNNQPTHNINYLISLFPSPSDFQQDGWQLWFPTRTGWRICGQSGWHECLGETRKSSRVAACLVVVGWFGVRVFLSRVQGPQQRKGAASRSAWLVPHESYHAKKTLSAALCDHTPFTLQGGFGDAFGSGFPPAAGEGSSFGAAPDYSFGAAGGVSCCPLARPAPGSVGMCCRN